MAAKYHQLLEILADSWQRKESVIAIYSTSITDTTCLYDITYICKINSMLMMYHLYQCMFGLYLPVLFMSGLHDCQ